MNRLIKFRAYNEVSKKMLDWYEFLDTNMKNTFIAPESTALILMQYTGLKDINGIEIYEGDIVAENNHYVNSDKLVYKKIQWKENYSCWLRGEYQRLTPANIKKYQIAVVGNIYTKANLLEEGD